MQFDEETIQKLNALTLVATRVRAGRMRGDRRSSKRGTSIEFADFRNYTPGDDIRRLDWNIYARLDKPFIKLFEEEEDLAVYLLLDASKSMNWGGDSAHKFSYARLVAASLGSIALAGGDQLSAHQLSETGEGQSFGPARGVQQNLRYFNYLWTLEADRRTRLAPALTHFAQLGRRPGLFFLISDLLDPDGFESSLDTLLARGHEIVVIHLLSPDEIAPQIAGDLQLVDREYGDTQEVSIDPVMLETYRRKLGAWRGQIQAFCRRRDIHYVHTSTELPWERFILQNLRSEGIVR